METVPEKPFDQPSSVPKSKLEKQLLRRLTVSFLAELGSAACYRRQAQLTLDAELDDRLTAFIEDESAHARRLAQIIVECGGAIPIGKTPTVGLFAIFGFVTGLLGAKAVLSFDMMLERTGIDLYEALMRLRPDAQQYRQDVAEMIADEQRHQAWFRQKRGGVETSPQA